ncbi:response regulator transcription factor [Denitratisoma sp. agr-D3]
MIRILICDDHTIVRQGLRQILADTDDILVTAEAGSGAEALRLVREGDFDLVLLDIAMPQRDGLDVLKQLKDEFPRLPVLILSTYPEKQYALRCLKLRASGYLNKSSDPDQLAAAIRKAATGGRVVSPALAEILAEEVAQPVERLPHEMLSHREYQVFCQIAQGHSVGQIAEQLALSPNTVSTYRARILEKIGGHNDVEIALYAVKHALVTP